MQRRRFLKGVLGLTALGAANAPAASAAIRANVGRFEQSVRRATEHLQEFERLTLTIDGREVAGIVLRKLPAPFTRTHQLEVTEPGAANRYYRLVKA